MNRFLRLLAVGAVALATGTSIALAAQNQKPRTGGGGSRPPSGGGNRPSGSGGSRPSGGFTQPGGSSFGRPGSSVDRPGNSGSRPGSSVGRPGNSVGRPGSSVSRPGSSVDRPGSSVGRPGSSVSRPGSSVSRPGSSVSRPGSSVGRPGSSVSRPGSSVSRPGSSVGGPGRRPANTASGKGSKVPQPKNPGTFPKPPAAAARKYTSSVATKGQLANGGKVIGGDDPSVRGLAGVDPGGFSLVIPNDPARPDGAAVLASLNTNSIASVPGDETGNLLGTARDNTWQTTRYLRLANATKARVTANVLYRTQNDQGDWVWLPIRPRAGGEPLSVELQPGEVTNLADNDWTIQGDRVRLWATSAENNEWSAFKDKDLWLVPETDPADKDKHGYYSPQVETITFTLR